MVRTLATGVALLAFVAIAVAGGLREQPPPAAALLTSLRITRP